MEILKQHFSNDEIKTIEARDDYEVVKKQVEKMMQAEKMLDALASRIGEKIKQATSLEEKWTIFKESLSGSDDDGENTIFDFDTLSLDKVRGLVKDGVDGAKEYVEKKETELLNAGEEKIKGALWPITKLPLIGEWLSEIIISGVKEKYESGKGNIWTFILGLFPGGALAMKGWDWLRKDDSEETVSDSSEQEGGETPEKEEKQEENGEVLQGVSKSGYESAGFRIIALQSGIEKRKNEETLGVYKDIKEKSLGEIMRIFQETNREKAGALKEALGITGTIEDKELEKIILGLVGPFNRSFLQSSIGNLSSIKKLIYNEDGEIHDSISAIFTSKELEELKEKNYDYEKISVSITARLVSVYWKNMGARGLHYMGEIAQNTGSTAYKFLFGGELLKMIEGLGDNTRESGVFPQKIALFFKDDTLGKKDLDMTGRELRSKSDIEFNDEEIKKFDDFISFRDKEVKDYIANHFSLGMGNFKESFLDSLNYGNIGALYVMLDGEPISRLDANRKLLIYSWIFSILGDKQGEYAAAIGDTLHKGSDSLSKDETNILLVMSYRIVEGQRNGTIKLLKNIYGAGHETIKNQLPEEVSEYADWIAWGIEAGGAVGLWKILGLFPTTRAVLFVSAGVGIGGLYYFTGEAGYQKLDSERQKVLNSFIVKHFSGEGSTSPEEIRNNIQNGTISFENIVSKMSEVDIFTDLFST